MKKVFLILFLLPTLLFSQQTKRDSLFTLLRKDKEDSNKVKHLNNLGWEFRNSNPDTAVLLTKQAYELAGKIHLQKEIAHSLRNFGTYNLLGGNFPKALDYYFQALEISKKTNDKKGISATMGNMGIVYYDQGNYPKALEYDLNALKIDEELHNKTEINKRLGNIGNIYDDLQDYPKALDYYLQALAIAQEIGNKNGIANQLVNIGIIYNHLKDYPKALEYDFKALQLAKELGDIRLQANVLGNIGSVYIAQKDYTKALDNFSQALQFDEQLGDKNSIAITIANIGAVYTEQQKYKDASDYLYRSLGISDSIKSMNIKKLVYESLSLLYQVSTVSLPDSAGGKLLGKEQMRLRSLYYFKRSISLRDSLFSQENKKQLIRNEVNFESKKKEAADSVKNVEQAKLEKVKAEATLNQEKTKRYALYVGIGLLLVFGGFIFNRFRITKKQKQLIELKSEETEQQKKIIEEKQKEIVDSINYARRIQYTLLAHEKLLWANLNDHFVFFKPKDIVSGDFYWATKVERRTESGERISKFFLACCDSTGHGVPGAFMSLLNISFLNEAIIEKNILEPNEVLNHVRKRLIENISQEGGQDGMDAVLICIDKTTNKISYSAANNSPVIISNGEIKELPFDKMPVGKADDLSPFTLHTIEAKKGDSLFLYTDGYADQFGGSKGKKFKYKQLHELLLSIVSEKAAKQSEILNQHFSEWKGNLEQVDDVLVIGMRI